jgi:hypothetical protein
MATTLEQIMQALEARLKTIPAPNELRAADTIPGSIMPPAAMVGCPDIENYRETMGRGKYRLQFTITVFTSAAWDRTGQLKLAAYANPTGPSSIITAVEADKTLGGLVDDCMVVGFRKLGLEEWALLQYFGGEFTVQVVANGV